MFSFLARIPLQRRWWQVLFWVNFVGSLYGYWWYRGQLLATPIWQWPVVPDSPTATLLFSGFLLALLCGVVAAPRGGRPVHLVGWVGWLAAFAFLTDMKYGLWTAIVLPQAALVTGLWTFDAVHLSLSHLGMWLEAVLFLRYYRPPWPAALAAVAWVYFQDYVDYWVLGSHPYLPAGAAVASVSLIALGLSTVWGLYLLLKTLRRRTPQRAAA